MHNALTEDGILEMEERARRAYFTPVGSSTDMILAVSILDK